MQQVYVHLGDVYGRIEHMTHGQNIKQYINSENNHYWHGCSNEQAIDKIYHQNIDNNCRLYLKGTDLLKHAVDHPNNSVITIYIPGLRQKYTQHSNGFNHQERLKIQKLNEEQLPFFEEVLSRTQVTKHPSYRDLPWSGEYNMTSGRITKYDVLRIPTRDFLRGVLISARITFGALSPQDARHQLIGCAFGTDMKDEFVTFLFRYENMVDRFGENIIRMIEHL